MPRYIWVVEIGYLQQWKASELYNGLEIFAEFIYDSSMASTSESKADFLAMHLPGGIFTRCILGEDMQEEITAIISDRPYRPLEIASRP